MASYARKTCSACGLRMPQPEMRGRLVSPISVRGTPLPPRMKWFCSSCDEKELQKLLEELKLQSLAKEKYAAELRQQKEVYDNKKKRWQEEQEQRRLENIEKRRSDAKDV